MSCAMRKKRQARQGTQFNCFTSTKEAVQRDRSGERGKVLNLLALLALLAQKYKYWRGWSRAGERGLGPRLSSSEGTCTFFLKSTNTDAADAARGEAEQLRAQLLELEEQFEDAVQV